MRQRALSRRKKSQLKSQKAAKRTQKVRRAKRSNYDSDSIGDYGIN